ncbi:MAG: HIT family protein [Microscillaceae bacterium]|nr:HIT family protein [Microscillaceae bacterium]
MASIFTKIVRGEIPAYKIAENENFLAFLDIFPVVKGHTLVIPKQEVDYIFDLEDQILSDLHLFSKQVAKALKASLGCQRISVIVAGFEVPHAHIHLIPSNSMEDLSFSHKLKLAPEEFVILAEQIRTHWV